MKDSSKLSSMDPVARLLAVADTHPGVCAIDGGRDHVTTYGALASAVRRLAGAFVGACPPGSKERLRVLIAVPRGEDAYAAMFGALMAGGQYAPINADAPKARRDAIARSFEPDIILTDEPDEWIAANATVLPLARALSAAPMNAPRPGGAVAYTIFTSGSTGEPKGVVVGREGLADFIKRATAGLGLGPGVRCSQHPNIAFDLSVMDIFGALTTGATLVPILSPADRLMPGRAIKNRKISCWISVPSVIDLISKAGQMTPEFLGDVTHFYFCGEPLLPSHLDQLFKASTHAKVINAYGPTEATVACTELQLTRETYKEACRHSVAIGSALPGMRVELTGGKNESEGEIVIIGSQVAHGYWRDDERTHARFGVDEATGLRLFRTGDWARRVDDQIFFVARIDRQIKRNGHRIELGEIDATLRSVLGGISVATISTENNIVSFIETDAQSLNVPELRTLLRKSLPEYMVPQEILPISELPRSMNDKIDFAALEKLHLD